MGVTANDARRLPVVYDARSWTSHQLQAGDILIHHAEKGDRWKEGLNPTYHVSMVTQASPDRLMRMDSSPSNSPAGVAEKNMNTFPDAATVFRLAPSVGSHQGAAAAAIARRWKKEVGYRGGSSVLCFGAHLVNLAFHSSAFQADARARLARYKQRDGYLPTAVICSEFAILCYQLAINEGSPGFIHLDAKHTSPHRLEEYLAQNKQEWQLVGVALAREYRGKVA
jgi:hypothetical protein